MRAARVCTQPSQADHDLDRALTAPDNPRTLPALQYGLVYASPTQHLVEESSALVGRWLGHDCMTGL
jgi:hypothetical protein